MAFSSDQVTKFITATLQYRWLLIFSWVMSIASLLLGLLLFLLGDMAEPGQKGMAMLVFDISSLGLSSYESGRSTTELHRHISELVPTDISHPLSITRWLGTYDWYSISYRWVCKGYYGVVKGKDGRPTLSNNMVEANCTQVFYGTNVTFSLKEQLWTDIEPAVGELVTTIPIKTFELRPIFWSWFAAVICTLLVFLSLPWMFRRDRLLGTQLWCLAPTFLALVSFVIYVVAWCMIEHLAYSSAVNNLTLSVATPFRAMTIACIISMLCCCVLGLAGYGGGVLLAQNAKRKSRVNSVVSCDHIPDIGALDSIAAHRRESRHPEFDMHPGYDGTLPSIEQDSVLHVEEQPMQILPPDPIREGSDELRNAQPAIDENKREEERTRRGVAEIPGPVSRREVKQDARGIRCGHKMTHCPTCGMASQGE